jgi:hypothetical protein
MLYQPYATACLKFIPIMHNKPCRILATVLQRDERPVELWRNVPAFFRAYAYDTAFLPLLPKASAFYVACHVVTMDGLLLIFLQNTNDHTNFKWQLQKTQYEKKEKHRHDIPFENR